jgi:hypothetical protein
MEEARIAEVVVAFADRFFSNELSVAQKELDFIYDNGFKKPEIDYIKIYRFLITAYNHLKTIDPRITDELLMKIYQDVERIHAYLIEFMKKIKMHRSIYENDFLPSVPEYRTLQNDVTITEAMKKRFQSIAASTERELATLAPPKTPEEIAYQKTLRGRNVDAIDGLAKAKEKLLTVSQQLKELESLMKDQFYKQFNEYATSIRDGLCEVLHTKGYYFDKLLWENAANSQLIQKSFRQAQIEGDYSTKTFIRYYLRNIDINKSNTSDWHIYLQEVLKVLD